MSQDPYAFSAIPDSPGDVDSSHAILRTARSLAGWQLMFAIFMGLGTLLLFVFMLLTPLMATTQNRGDSISRIIGSLVGMGILGLIYGLPTYFLFDASKQLRLFARQEMQLQEMLQGQLRFWRVIGILFIIAIVFYIIAIMVALGAWLIVTPSFTR